MVHEQKWKVIYIFKCICEAFDGRTLTSVIVFWYLSSTKRYSHPTVLPLQKWAFPHLSAHRVSFWSSSFTVDREKKFFPFYLNYFGRTILWAHCLVQVYPGIRQAVFVCARWDILVSISNATRMYDFTRDYSFNSDRDEKSGVRICLLRRTTSVY